MRVLVQQTSESTKLWLSQLNLVADETNDSNSRWSRSSDDNGAAPIAVHLLLGGEGKSDWALWPDRDAILIGTQDMLLSRALNRGYAAGRARWPQEFGLLNSDCMWVFDEIQLMDTGLATSLQLDAWRRSLRLRGSRKSFPQENSKHLARPCHSLWMSATMAKHWLSRAVDFAAKGGVDELWDRHRLVLGEHTFSDGTIQSDMDSPRVNALFKNTKGLEKKPVAMLKAPRKKELKLDDTEYISQLTKAIEKHRSPDGLTLVIVNTVDRARRLYESLPKPERDNGHVCLIHSRFRPAERASWKHFLRNDPSVSRVIVSTQVVEAGVDLSAKVLLTELAPWASLVQRFGRCARFVNIASDGTVCNEHGAVYWMNLDNDERVAIPYQVEELKAARGILEGLNDVGLQSLADLKDSLDKCAATLFPYDPRFVPREKDLFDLFDTTPDLTGADVDISRYIRDGEELDIQVFWRELPENRRKPWKKDKPSRDELCPVPFMKFRDFLKSVASSSRVWRRHYRNGWEQVYRGSEAEVYPGQVFWLEPSCGGYSAELGWTGASTDRVTPVDLDDIAKTVPISDEDGDDSDALSEINQWLTIEEHSRHVCEMLDMLLPSSGISKTEEKTLRLAARLHDWGKAHAAFQAKIEQDKLSDARQSGMLRGEFAAKAPAWRRDKVKRSIDDPSNVSLDHRRPGFRHELASALAILEAVYRVKPDHEAFAWPVGLNPCDFADGNDSRRDYDHPLDSSVPILKELIALTSDELDLLVYLVASHHGKVRMSLRSSTDDGERNVPDPCPENKRQARGVRDHDTLPSLPLPAFDIAQAESVPAVSLSLELMELGLSPRYGASWRERTQMLLERLGPFHLGYLEAILRAADCRASAEERATVSNPLPGNKPRTLAGVTR